MGLLVYSLDHLMSTRCTFDPEAWNIRRETVSYYKPIDPEDGSEPITRVYLEPQVMDFVTNEWRAADRNCSIENKVE